MNEDNPFRAPTAVDPPEPRGPRQMGPVLAGLIAIVVATLLLGLGGLLISIVSVGSWWVHKFWPRPPAPDDAGAREFLQKLESSRTRGNSVSKPIQSVADEPPADPLGNLRL